MFRDEALTRASCQDCRRGDDPVVGVGDGLGPRRDQRDYGDHGVDAAQQLRDVVITEEVDFAEFSRL